MHKYLSFTVGGLHLGVDMTNVISIERGSLLAGDKVTELRPGTVSHGGREVALYNLSILICGDAAQHIRVADPRILIVRSGIIPIAFYVDQISNVDEVADGDISSMPPLFTGMARDSFPHVIKGQAGLIPVICPEAIERAVFDVQMTAVESALRESGVPDGMSEQLESAIDPVFVSPEEVAFSDEVSSASLESETGCPVVSEKPVADMAPGMVTGCFSVDDHGPEEVPDDPFELEEEPVADMAPGYLSGDDHGVEEVFPESDGELEPLVSERDFIFEELLSEELGDVAETGFEFMGDPVAEADPQDGLPPGAGMDEQPDYPLDAMLEKMIPHDLLEKVIDRVVGNMVNDRLSHMIAEIPDSPGKRDVEVLFSERSE